MAATHRWKVYTANGSYEASVSEPTLGAIIIAGSCMGIGSTIRDGHTHVCFIEGPDGEAAESYDAAAELCWDRVGGGGWLSPGRAAQLTAKWHHEHTD